MQINKNMMNSDRKYSAKSSNQTQNDNSNQFLPQFLLNEMNQDDNDVYKLLGERPAVPFIQNELGAKNIERRKMSNQVMHSTENYLIESKGTRGSLGFSPIFKPQNINFNNKMNIIPNMADDFQNMAINPNFIPVPNFSTQRMKRLSHNNVNDFLHSSAGFNQNFQEFRPRINSGFTSNQQFNINYLNNNNNFNNNNSKCIYNSNNQNCNIVRNDLSFNNMMNIGVRPQFCYSLNLVGQSEGINYLKFSINW
jgi:hypothetical protein